MMMSDAAVDVRSARASDRAALAAVQHDAWHAAYGEAAPASVVASMTSEHVESVWQGWSADDAGGSVLVATHEGAIVGFVAVAWRADAVAEVLSWHVVPMHQRSGHASRLFHSMVLDARDRGVERLTAWVPTADAAKLKFCQDCGMKPTGGRRQLDTGVEGEKPMVEIEVGATVVHEEPAAE